MFAVFTIRGLMMAIFNYNADKHQTIFFPYLYVLGFEMGRKFMFSDASNNLGCFKTK